MLDQKDINDQEADFAAAFARQHQLALRGRGIAPARTDSSRSAYVFDFGRKDDEFGPRVKAYVAKRREKLAPLEKVSTFSLVSPLHSPLKHGMRTVGE